MTSETNCLNDDRRRIIVTCKYNYNVLAQLANEKKCLRLTSISNTSTTIKIINSYALLRIIQKVPTREVSIIRPHDMHVCTTPKIVNIFLSW